MAPPAPLLFLVGGGAAGAEDGDDDDDDDGDDTHGHDDHQQHVAVQGGRGAAVGTVTACEGTKGSFVTQEKQAVPTKDTQSPADQQEGMDLTRNLCFFGIYQLFLYNCSSDFDL